jgi:hypothetical protein
MVDLATRLKEDALHVRRFLIIDSCFAAASFREFQSSPLEVAAVKALRDLPTSGTALLCSSSRDDVSLAPTDAGYTMFSSALLDVLNAGDATLDRDFTLEEIGESAREGRNGGSSSRSSCPRSIERGYRQNRALSKSGEGGDRLDYRPRSRMRTLRKCRLQGTHENIPVNTFGHLSLV